MTYIRARVWAETEPGAAKLSEYSEIVELFTATDLYQVGVAALKGYRDAVNDHRDVVEHPHSLCLILEPFDPPLRGE